MTVQSAVLGFTGGLCQIKCLNSVELVRISINTEFSHTVHIVALLVDVKFSDGCYSQLFLSIHYMCDRRSSLY